MLQFQFFIVKKINSMMCSLIPFSLNASFHRPRTHYSTISTFQYSNWGEAPNLNQLAACNGSLIPYQPAGIQAHLGCRRGPE